MSAIDTPFNQGASPKSTYDDKPAVDVVVGHHPQLSNYPMTGDFKTAFQFNSLTQGGSVDLVSPFDDVVKESIGKMSTDGGPDKKGTTLDSPFTDKLASR